MGKTDTNTEEVNGNEYFQLLINKLKKIYSLKRDKDIAELLGILPAGYSTLKKNNRFPYDKIVHLAIRDNFSLDDFFDIEEHKNISSNKEKRNKELDDDFTDINKIGFLNKENEYIHIPSLFQNKNTKYKAFAQNNQFYIIDTSVTTYTASNVYLIEKDGIFYIREIDASLKDTFLIKNINGTSDSFIEIDQATFENFNIVGVVENYISIKKLFIDTPSLI